MLIENLLSPVLPADELSDCLKGITKHFLHKTEAVPLLIELLNAGDEYMLECLRQQCGLSESTMSLLK